MNERLTGQDAVDATPKPLHTSTDESALDEILPSQTIELSPIAPPSSAFKPWHLPRKQHIRKTQWGSALARLLDDLPDRTLIKYLCLPGEDLLDVEALAVICREKARRLKYLGFDQNADSSRRSTQRIAAEQLVRQTAVIDEASIVLPDDFASISRKNSIGNSRLRDGGSYDVVNLDMCDAFTTSDSAPTHAAMLELLTHQTNRRGEPWLLFLTTRSEIGRLKTLEVTAYADVIAKNAQKSEIFRESLSALATKSCADVSELLECVRQAVEGCTLTSGKWLAIGIGKWLLGIMAQQDQWRVDILSTYCYRTGLLSENGAQYAGEPPNLFSMVFRFEKVRRARVDPAGIVVQPASTFAEIDEVRLAEKLAKAVINQTIDLDAMMTADTEVYEALRLECESSLSVRYYSVPQYRELIDRLPAVASPGVSGAARSNGI